MLKLTTNLHKCIFCEEGNTKLPDQHKNKTWQRKINSIYFPSTQTFNARFHSQNHIYLIFHSTQITQAWRHVTTGYRFFSARPGRHILIRIYDFQCLQIYYVSYTQLFFSNNRVVPSPLLHNFSFRYTFKLATATG